MDYSTNHINFFYKYKNDFLITLDENYIFIFSEIDDVDKSNLFKDCYLNLHNYSININLTAKWTNWALFFFNELSSNIANVNNDNYFKNPIQKDIVFPKKEPHILLINDEIMLSNDMIAEKIKNANENTLFQFELRLNLDEYLLLTGFIWPELGKIEKKL